MQHILNNSEQGMDDSLLTLSFVCKYIPEGIYTNLYQKLCAFQFYFKILLTLLTAKPWESGADQDALLASGLNV